VRWYWQSTTRNLHRSPHECSNAGTIPRSLPQACIPRSRAVTHPYATASAAPASTPSFLAQRRAALPHTPAKVFSAQQVPSPVSLPRCLVDKLWVPGGGGVGGGRAGHQFDGGRSKAIGSPRAPSGGVFLSVGCQRRRPPPPLPPFLPPPQTVTPRARQSQRMGREDSKSCGSIAEKVIRVKRSLITRIPNASTRNLVGTPTNSSFTAPLRLFTWGVPDGETPTPYRDTPGLLAWRRVQDKQPSRRGRHPEQ